MDIQIKDIELLDILTYPLESGERRRLVISFDRKNLKHLSYTPNGLAEKETPIVCACLPKDEHTICASSVPWERLKKRKATNSDLLYFLGKCKSEWARKKIKKFLKERL